MLVDGLVNSGDDHGGVSSVLAGSIDGMAEPGTIRQSLGHEKRALCVAQGPVHLGGIAGIVLLPDKNLRCGLFEVMSRSRSLGEVHGLAHEFSQRSFLCGIDVESDFSGVFLVIVGEHIGVGHAQDRDAEDTRHLLLVSKIGIAKFLEPVEVVKSGVINAIGTGRTNVGGGHSEVLQEDGVVGSASQVTHGHASFDLRRRRTIVGGRGLLRIRRVGLAGFLPILIDRTSLGTGDSLGDIAQKLFQAGH